MDGVKGRIAAKDTIHCGNVAVQDCSAGGACGEREEEEGPLSAVAFEVGRWPAVSKLQM